MKCGERIASLTVAPSVCAGMRARQDRIAVGVEAADARIVLQQQRHPAANDGGDGAERQVSAAPSQRLDQQRRQRRHHQCANADAAHGKTGGKAAPSHEPALHRADRGHIGAADAKSDTEAVSGIDLEQIACGTRRGEPEADQQHAGQREAAGAVAVGEGATDDAEGKIEKARERKHQRDRAARGAEIALQRLQERAERIGAAEADKGHGECGGHDEPAVEDAGVGQRGLDTHDCLHGLGAGWRRCQDVILWKAAPARISVASSRCAATS